MGQFFLQLFREQLAELVLEPLTLFVRERQIARIGADPQHLGIDQFDGQVAGVIALRAGNIAADEYGSDREKRDQQAAILIPTCHHAFPF